MSAIHSAPSGPVWIVVGRNQLSLDARNSLACSSGARRLVYATPRALITSRCTRLCTGSLTNEFPANAGPNKSSRYTIALQADVNRFSVFGALNRSSVRLTGYTGDEPGTAETFTRGSGPGMCGFRRM